MKRILTIIISIYALGVMPTSATTYNYFNDAYTLNADPAIYGSNMVGSVTFNQDMSDFTGTVYLSSGLITNLSLTSGTISATLPYFDIFADPASPYFSPLFFPDNPNGLVPDYFELVNGNIQAWLLHGITPSYQLVAPSYQLYSQGDFSIYYGSNGFDNIQSNFPTGTVYASVNATHNSNWSPIASVPGPVVGAGIPGLLAALGMLGLGWRRRQRSNAPSTLGAGIRQLRFLLKRPPPSWRQQSSSKWIRNRLHGDDHDWMRLRCGMRVIRTDDSRHEGRVEAIHHGAYAKVRWDADGMPRGWLEDDIPLGDLTRVRAEWEAGADRCPARRMRKDWI